MRAVGWGGIAALTLLAGAAAADAQPPRNKSMPQGWWGNLWGESKPKEDPKAAGAKSLTMEEKARELDRLEKAFLRREAVCDKLAAIGEATENQALIDLAADLLETARTIHNRQSYALGFGTVGASDAEADEPYELPRPAREPNAGIVPARMRSGGLSAGTSEPSRSGEGQR